MTSLGSHGVHPMMTIRNFTLYLLIGLVVLPAFAMPAAPPAGIRSPHFTPKERADLASLPPPKPAETELFAYLTRKTGKASELPAHPRDVSALGSWFFARQTSSHDPVVVYPLLYENLLVARGLLSASDIDRQRLGLVVARYSEVTARLNLQDYRLDAHICEAFLIPHLDIAYPENGHTVSRRQILEDTHAAYEGTGDRRHELTVLLFLLRYADCDNTRNWTRLMLAQTYENAGNYGQAIAFLNTTYPLDKDWLARLQQERAKNLLPLPKANAARGSHS